MTPATTFDARSPTISPMSQKITPPSRSLYAAAGWTRLRTRHINRPLHGVASFDTLLAVMFKRNPVPEGSGFKSQAGAKRPPG